MDTNAALEAAHLNQLDAIEQQGIALLNAGANPARMVAALYAVVTRLQIEGRFRDVDTAKIEDIMNEIADAQEDEGRP